jgi:hypothetical protein
MMKQSDRDAECARSAAGHNALRIIAEYGVALGTDMLRVVAMTYLRSLAAVIGWPETLRLVQECSALDYTPPRGAKLRLVSQEVHKNLAS